MTRRHNTRSILAIVGIVTSAALLAACTADDPIVTPSPNSETESPAPQTGAGGILPNGVSDFGPSPYVASTIADDDPAMQLDPDEVSDAAAQAYSPQELASAQAFLVRFVAEHVIDTPLINASGEDGAKWFEAHQDAFDPNEWDTMREPLTQPGVGGVIPDFEWRDGDTVLEVEYSQDTPRLIEREIEVDEIELSDRDDALVFELDLEGRIVGTEVGGEARELFLFIEGDADFALLPSGDSWMIAGFSNDLHAQTQSR